MCSLSRVHQRSIKLGNSNTTKQHSSPQLEERIIKDGSLQSRITERDELSGLLSRQSSSPITTFNVKRASFSQYEGRHNSFKVDTYQALESLLASLGLTVPPQWSSRLRLYFFGLTYSSTTHYLYLNEAPTVLKNINRKFRFHLPAFAFQFQTANLPRSITYKPIVQCESQIFKLCLDGNIETVKLWFKRSWASPFVVNQHGENLLHVSNCPVFLAENLISKGRRETCTCGTLSFVARYWSGRSSL
jgi:hypothetical protein